VIDGWKWVPILLNLQRVLDGATSANLTKFIMQNLVEFGSMTKTNVANKSVCFGTNGVIIFQGLKKWCHHKDDAKPCSIYEWCALYGTLHKLGCPNFEQFEFGGKN